MLDVKDYRDFDNWVLDVARNPQADFDMFATRCAEELSSRTADRWALAQAKMLGKPMAARQYFNSQTADSLIVPAGTGSVTSLTGIFTPAQANQAFPLGYGLAAPFAGQVYHFTFGGILTTNSSSSTLVITPVHGPSSAQVALTGATSMGASAAQTMVASLAAQPFYAQGYLVYRSISAVATTSTAWLTGIFKAQGTLATAGSGLGIVYGSTAAVNVDTTGTGTAGSYGALNFGCTFSVQGSVTAEWTSMQSLN